MLEKELIIKYDAQNTAHGYNVMEGGAAPVIPDSVRKKMSEAHIGIPHSPEAIAKSAAHRTGLKRSEETCHRISEAKKGYPKPPNSGMKPVRVRCVETGEEFDSASEAARTKNVSRSHIRDAC